MQKTGYRSVPWLWGVRRGCRPSRSWRCCAVDTARHHGRSQVLSRVGRRASFSPGQGTYCCCGHPVLCVCHGPDSTRNQAEIQALWRRSAALIRSACQVSLPLVVLCDANAWVGSVASLAVGDLAADWEDTADAEFHAMLLEWDLCLPVTLPGPHNDPAKPSGTWRIDFVAVPRDWLAGVRRAEVEAAVALPGSGSFDHAMPMWRWSFRFRRQVTSVQEVLTLLARLCGDLRFASRSSFSGLRLLPFLRSFRWMSTPTYWQRLPRWLGDVRLLGYRLRHRLTGWMRRLGRREEPV